MAFLGHMSKPKADGSSAHVPVVQHMAGGGSMSGQFTTSNGFGISPFVTQSSFGADAPPIQQQQFQPQISALQGQQAQTYGQQQNLVGQLQGVASGTGPNPAQAQLNQATGQNIANQSALMAGQRGSGANVGLMARQAAMQGGNIQQQAVGQGATLQAQQQLAAQNALANVYGNMAGQSLQGESIQQQAQAAQNNALNQGYLGAQGINAATSMNNANNANAVGQSVVGGLFGGGASALMSAFSDGGEVQLEQPYAAPALTNFSPNVPNQPSMSVNIQSKQKGNKPKSQLGQQMAGGPGDPGGTTDQTSSLGTDAGPTEFSANGGMIKGEQFASSGQMVPGQADVAGDSLKNDTIPAMLSPKEIVLPRHITMGPDAPERAKSFVAAILAKNRGMRRR